MKFLVAILITTMLSAAAIADDSIRHVVQFKFKKDAPKEQVDKVVTEFAALAKKIDVIQSLEWGTNNSPEGFNKGFTHCWIVTFKTAKDRDTYLKHPDHEAFVAILKPVLEDAQVLDFTPGK